MADGYISSITLPNDQTYDLKDKYAVQGNGRVFYGTCSTSAATVPKIVDCANYDTLTIGDILVVKFSATNSATANDSLQLQIKNAKNETTTAVSIKQQYNSTGNNNLNAIAQLNKDGISTFVYNGTYWILLNGNYNNTYTLTEIWCNSSATTAAKVASNSTYYYNDADALGTNSPLKHYFELTLRYSNTTASALTLNINSSGVKPIYINGNPSSSTNYTLPRGKYLVYFDGTNYQFRTDGKIPGNIHTHGNINNDGTLTATATIANGDKILLSTSANSGKIVASSITFDGSTTSSVLSKKGTWVSMYTHPTGDGNKHVPANGTGNSDKFLKATATAGTYVWSDLPTATTETAGIIQIGTGASNAMAGDTIVNQVKQSNSTSTSWRKVLLSGLYISEPTSSITSGRDLQVYYTDGIAIKPNTKSLFVEGSIYQGNTDNTVLTLSDVTSTVPSNSSTTYVPTAGAVYSAITSASGYGCTGTVTSITIKTSSPLTGGSDTATTSTGTYTIGFATQNKNLVLASSTNTNSKVPSFRSLENSDLPTVGITKGGTNITSYKLGDILYASAANTLAALNGNSTTASKFLRSKATTNGTTKAPTWEALVADDIPSLSWNKITSNKPTTLTGYGITDAKIDSNIITLGSTTMEPILSVNGHSGSSITLTAGDLNLSSALRFIGTTTSAMTDPFTGVPQGIANYTTPIVGDVVIDSSNDSEYVCISATTGTSPVYTWERLGRDGSWALNDHVHGNISNTGTIGTVSNRPVITTNNGLITTATTIYIENNKIAINSTAAPTENLYVNGKVQIDIGSNYSASANNFIITGTGSNDEKFKLSIGAKGIQAYTNTDFTTFNLQYFGGDLQIGTADTTAATRALYGKFTFHTTKGFNYAGMESASVSANRVVWFSQNGQIGTPVYNSNFTYNPGNKTLIINDGTVSATTFTGNLIGNASAAHRSTTNTAADSWIKIKIKQKTSWMLSFTVRIYASYIYRDYVISGYNYGTRKWYLPTAILLGSSSTDEVSVKFGYDDDAENNYCTLWVAIPCSNYYGVDIYNVTNGHTNVMNNISSLFEIIYEKPLTGTLQTNYNNVKVTRPVYRHEAPNLLAIEALNGTSGILTKTAENTWTLDTNTYSLDSHDHDSSYLALSGGTLGGNLTLVSANNAISNAANKRINWYTLSNNTLDTEQAYLAANNSGNLGINALNEIWIRPGTGSAMDTSTKSLVINQSKIYSYTTKTHSLGDSTHEFNGIYSTTGDFSSIITAKALTISSTAAESHIQFTRGPSNDANHPYNYISTPSGSEIRIIGGTTYDQKYSAMIIKPVLASGTTGVNTSTYIFPGRHNIVDLGTTDYRWRHLYIGTSIIIGDTAFTSYTTADQPGAYIGKQKISLSQTSTGNENGYFLIGNDSKVYGRFCITAYGIESTPESSEGADDGTQGAAGSTLLYLGNNIAQGEKNTSDGAGNAYGRLRLYGTNDHYAEIRTQDQTTTDRIIYLPNSNKDASPILVGSYDLTNTQDLNNKYNAGIYCIEGGKVSNYPSGGSKYANLLVLPYSKPYGNDKPGYASQIYMHTYAANDGSSKRLWYRGSNETAWEAWQEVAHIDANTAVGGEHTPVYVAANGTVTTCTTIDFAHGGTGTTNHTQNRLVWSQTDSSIQAGYHYASTTKIAVNSVTEPSYNFYVNGSSYLNGEVTLAGSTSTISSSLIKFTGLGEGLEFSSGANYFGTNAEARIISLIDTNSGGSAVDGGLIINAIGRSGGVDSATQELLRIRNHNGSADWKTGEFQWKTKDIVVELGSSKAWDISVKKDKDGNQIDTTYAKLASANTFTQQNVFSGGTDASLSASSGFIIVGNPTSTHIAIDDNEIMAKSTSGTTPSTLYLNNDSGLVQIGQNWNSTTVANNNTGLLVYSVRGTNSPVIQAISKIQINSGYQWGLDHRVPNLQAGGNTCLLTGVANSTNNQAVLEFHYAGANHADNFVGLGLYGNNNLLTINKAGTAKIKCTTDSTSTATGALVVDGGIGVSKSLHINSSRGAYGIYIHDEGLLKKEITRKKANGSGWAAGLITAYGPNFEGDSFASIGVYGIADEFKYVYIGSGSHSATNNLRIYASGEIEIPYTGTSTSTSTGALRVAGGAGIAGDVYIGGNITLTTPKQIIRNGKTTSWNKGRDNAIFVMNTIDLYSPFASIKSTSGSWDIGTYDTASYINRLVFSYISDELYNGTNTVPPQIQFTGQGSIIAPRQLQFTSTDTIQHILFTRKNTGTAPHTGPSYINYPSDGLLAIGTATGYDNSLMVFDTTASVRPGKAATYSLGTSTYTWNGVYATSAVIGKIKICTGSDDAPSRKIEVTEKNLIINSPSSYGIVFQRNGTSTVQLQGYTFYPESTTSSLGLTTKRWGALYIGTADTYGTSGTPIYWNSGVPTACTASELKSTIGLSHIYYGSCTSAASDTTKVVTCDEYTTLTTGDIIFVNFTNTNTGTAANLQLQVNTTTAKPIKYLNNGSSSNIPGNGYIAANYTYRFIYNGSQWIMDVNSNFTAQQINLQGGVKAGATIVAGNLIVGNSDGLYYHLKTGDAFDIRWPILYAGSAIATFKSNGNVYSELNIAIGTTQTMTLITFAPIYIKGTLSGTTFTPISTTPLTQTIATDNDGYVYIYLGFAYSTSEIRLLANHPIYYYDGSSVQLYGGGNGSQVYSTTFEIKPNNLGVSLENNAFNANSYVTQIVITSGENYLPGPITWESSSSTIALRTSTAVSSTVSGYIIVQQGKTVSTTATDLTS